MRFAYRYIKFRIRGDHHGMACHMARYRKPERRAG